MLWNISIWMVFPSLSVKKLAQLQIILQFCVLAYSHNRRLAVKRGEWDRPKERPQPSGRTSICSFGQEGRGAQPEPVRKTSLCYTQALDGKSMGATNWLRHSKQTRCFRTPTTAKHHHRLSWILWMLWSWSGNMGWLGVTHVGPSTPTWSTWGFNSWIFMVTLNPDFIELYVILFWCEFQVGKKYLMRYITRNLCTSFTVAQS